MGRILVSIDGSLPATAALGHALARFVDEEITVLYVIDADEPDGSLRQRLLDEAFEERRRTGEETAGRVLEEARRRAAAESEAVAVSTYGRPARRTVAYAAENGIDRIVMGAHGRSGLSRLLLGSVSETVSRNASVSVTTVREAGEVEESGRPTPAHVA